MFLMYCLEGGSFRFPLGLPHHNSYLTDQRTNVGVTLLRVSTANFISSNHTLEDWGDDLGGSMDPVAHCEPPDLDPSGRKVWVTLREGTETCQGDG